MLPRSGARSKPIARAASGGGRLANQPLGNYGTAAGATAFIAAWAAPRAADAKAWAAPRAADAKAWAAPRAADAKAWAAPRAADAKAWAAPRAADANGDQDDPPSTAVDSPSS